MKFLPVFAFVLFLPAVAVAQDAPVLDASLCREIVLHKPDADVKYTPGVDVHGRPVVEAELKSSVVKAPEEIEFDLTVDVAKYIGLTAPAGVEGQARIGTVKVDKDGRVHFNGQPLEGEAETALRALCLEKGRKPPLQKKRNYLYNP